MMKNTPDSAILSEIETEWLSVHLYYHEDLGRAVRRFIDPLSRFLAKSRQITSFHFLRYSLGGPHVRVRFRIAPSDRAGVGEWVQRYAQILFDHEPSQQSIDKERILRFNKHILAGDSNEDDNSAYPDNTFRIAEFRPEIGRYGGPDLFSASLDFFTLSSLAALDLLAAHGDRPRPSQLVYIFQLLIRQALGFASSISELADLLRYGVDYWGERMPTIVEKGNRVADTQMSLFLRLFTDGLDELQRIFSERRKDYLTVDYLSIGASRLSENLPRDDRATRVRIGSSQLHMTASRLGLSNTEEVYISQLMTRTLEEVQARDFRNLSRLGEKLTHPAREADSALDHLLAPALYLHGEGSSEAA